jgi:alpha-amylase/alpha-mannosidase (GH57 family)
MTPLIIHGHFYQPPRENPWTGTIDSEASALPFHDWNDRIHAECYRPNSAALILDATGAERLFNNYAHISFDFGPTLLSWLATNHVETYARILAADAESVQRNNGHGNAIAQAYNHAILPLANERDRSTQVRWGLADFRYRFQREPEAMWLPETASNDEVMDLLIDAGMRFVILAPHQANRVRKTTGIPAFPRQTGKPGSQTTTDIEPEDDWHLVSDSTIDTSIPYRYYHRDDSGRWIAVFFYDQELARAIAFGRALASSASLVNLLGQRKAGRLINVATDGESYGHHHKFGELCLAYALAVDAPAQGFVATNYGDYLEQHPPQMEVEISNGEKGEGGSWSCTHGVSRWIRDCGCQTGGEAGWNQAWRGPLRKALDILRDEAGAAFEGTRGELFVDPWAARDESIILILDEQKSREEFLRAQASRDLTREEERRALLFLELQRNALLMYTSCGWFFSDLAGIEPIQILKYAGRAMDLMDQLGLPSPRGRFLEMLAEAKSNQGEFGNGADIYRQFVERTRVDQANNDVVVTR